MVCMVNVHYKNSRPRGERAERFIDKRHLGALGRQT